MEFNRIKKLLSSINIHHTYISYPTTVYLIGLAVEQLPLYPPPSFKSICIEASRHFGINRPERVSENLKTMLDSYCNLQSNIELFEKIIDYKVDTKLTCKEFVFELAWYLIYH